MTRFDLISAETKRAIKTNANARTLKATTALASVLAIGFGFTVLAPLVLASQVQADDNVVSVNDTWAEGDETTVGDTDVVTAAAGDNVNFTADAILTVTNDGTNNDGSGKDTFEIGAVTSTNSGQGTIAVQAEDDPATHDGNLIATIASVGTDADHTVKALSVNGGTGGTSVGGNTANTTVVDTAAAYIDTVSVTGGAGAANVDQNGGAASVTLQGALIGDLNITGGAGADTDNSTGDGGNGGSATATVFAGVTGDIRLTHGADGKDDDTTNALKAGTGNSATLSIGNGAGFTPDGGSSANPAVAQAITGSITAAADGDGTIVVNNAVGGTSAGVEITGNVGSSSAAIGYVDHTTGSLTLGGDVYVTDFKHTDGNLTFNGTSAQTITVVDNNRNDDTGTAGLISTKGKLSVENAAGVTFTTAVTLADGDVAIGGGSATSVATFSDALTISDGDLRVGKNSNAATNASTATFTGDVLVSDGSIQVDGGATGTFGGDITFTAPGGLAAIGTVVISGGTDHDSDSATHNVTTLTTTAGTNSVLDGGTLKLNNTLALADNASKLTFQDGATLELGITNGTAIDADVGSGLVTAGGSITIVASNAMRNGDQVILVNENSGLNSDTDATLEGGRFMDFAVEDIGTDVILTSTSKSIPDLAQDLSISEADAGRLLRAFNNSENSQFVEFLAGITNPQAALISDQTAVQEETLTAAVEATSEAANQIAAITVDRLASLRTGDAYGLEADQAAAGFATGDGAMSGNVWGKLFYNVADQDNTDNADGYDADTSGLAIGSDTEVGANMRIGASLAMSQSEVDGKGSGDAQSDIDSYQLTVYGDLTQSDYFIDWQVGASTSSVETTTTVDPTSGVSGSNSDYDSMTYVAKVGLGLPMDLGGEMEGTSRFTPYGSFGFQRISSDDYDLIFPDDPVLNQNVSPDDVNEFTLSLGGRYTMSGQTDGGGTVTPQIRGAISYDFIGDTAEATSTDADQTSVTVKGTEAEKIGAALGIGVNYVSDATSLGVDLDSTMKDGYASYTGALNFRLQF